MHQRARMATNSNEEYRYLLETENLRDNLQGNAVKGGFSSFIGEMLSFALRTISTIILARLLIPEHFGIISMVTAVTVFADRFKDLGLDIATIQRKSITHEQVSTLFWINTGIGAALTLLVAALSPVVAWFYKDQRLIAITVSIAFNFFIGGMAIQHQAILRRQMLFGKLAIIQVISLILSIIIGIILAIRGLGYWALVASQISASFFSAIGMFSACHWLPGRPRRGIGIRSMLNFGRDMTLFNIVYFLTRSLNKMLIGRSWGATSLGLYVQAEKLVLIPIEQTRVPLNNIAVSALSVLQEEQEKYREFCRRIIEIFAFITMPLSVFLFGFSDPIVRLFLGENWIGAIPIFKIFSICAFIGPLQFPCTFIMVTSGKTKRLILFGIAQSVLMIVGFSIGLHWGAVGVALGHLISNSLFLLPGLWISLNKTPVRMRLVFHAVVLPATGSFIVLAVVLLSSRLFNRMENFPYILFSLILAVGTYCVFWLIVPGGRSKLKTYISYSSHLIKKNQTARR